MQCKLKKKKKIKIHPPNLISSMQLDLFFFTFSIVIHIKFDYILQFEKLYE